MTPNDAEGRPATPQYRTPHADDKAKLVDTILRLWSIALLNRDRADNQVIYELVMAHRETVQPVGLGSGLGLELGLGLGSG